MVLLALLWFNMHVTINHSQFKILIWSLHFFANVYSSCVYRLQRIAKRCQTWHNVMFHCSTDFVYTNICVYLISLGFTGYLSGCVIKDILFPCSTDHSGITHCTVHQWHCRLNMLVHRGETVSSRESVEQVQGYLFIIKINCITHHREKCFHFSFWLDPETKIVLSLLIHISKWYINQYLCVFTKSFLYGMVLVSNYT